MEMPVLEPGSWLAGSLLFVVAFVFAMIETALYEFAETKLEEILGDRDRRARFRCYLERLNLMRFAAALLGGTACVALGILVAEGLAGKTQGGATGSVRPLPLLSAIVVAFLLGRMLPRSCGRRFPEHVLKFALPWVYRATWAFLPLAVVGRAAYHRFVVNGRDEPRADRADLEHEIMSVVSEGQKEGVFGDHARDMIEGILHLRHADAAEIMTPRTEMTAIDVSAPVEEARKLAVEDGHSRYPVYEENVDNVVGVLYVKDLLKHLSTEGWDGVAIRDVMRAPLYVPEAKGIADMLLEMRRKRVHIAIVLDEYGGTAGLVTVEDIIEEIVGEIEDEYDPANGIELVKTDATTVEADARVHIDDLNDALEIDLPEEEDFDTIGGFVFARLGRVPKTGDSFVHDGVEFTVLDADSRRINRLKVVVLRGEPE